MRLVVVVAGAVGGQRSRVGAVPWEAPAADTNRGSFLIATFCSFLSVTLHFSSSEGIYVMPSHFSASRRGLSEERKLP